MLAGKTLEERERKDAYLNDLIVKVFSVVAILHEEDELFLTLRILVQLDHIIVS